MSVTTKTYLKPQTVQEAISYAKQYGSNFRYLAGGTDVIVNKFQGNEPVDCLIDLSGIDTLKQIKQDSQFLKIGSLVRLEELDNSNDIRTGFPALADAAQAVASPMLRKTATVGGNILCENRCVFYNQSEWWREAVGYCLKCDGDICIATGGKKNCFSKFVSDLAPVLISLNSLVEISDITGNHTLPLESLYTGDGLKPKNLGPTAIIRTINIPVTEKYSCAFQKLRPRETVDFTSLTTAVSLSDTGKIRIVLGGVDPKPVLVEGSSESNIPELIDTATRKARIVNNDFYSRKYRKEMIPVLLNRCFSEIKKGTKH